MLNFELKITAFAGTVEALTALKRGRCVGLLYDDTAIEGDMLKPEWSEYDMPLESQEVQPCGLASEIFHRNCWISFEPVEGSIKVLADYIGAHKILWATDYPHPDGFSPGAPEMVRKNLDGLSPETKYQVMAG